MSNTTYEEEERRMMVIHQEEILLEILSRLPAKSIGQFRCVSKSWKSLLSEPHFIQTHLSQIKSKRKEIMAMLKTDHLGLYYTQFRYADHQLDEMAVVATELTSADDHPHCFNDGREEFLASADGLILVQGTFEFEIDAENETCYEYEKLFLLNPTTKEIKELLELPCPSTPDNCRYEIGYDSVSNDYKVVMLWYQPNCSRMNEVIIDVYSVNNGTWKRAGTFPNEHAAFKKMSSGITVKGHIQWLARNKDSSSSIILAFDLDKERFREVPLPSSIDVKDVSLRYLDEKGDCLCICPRSRSCDINVWVMEEYDVEKSWTKFTIHYSTNIVPLCLLGKEQLVLSKEWSPWESTDSRFLIYNLKDGSYKDIVLEDLEEDEDFTVECTFIESLVSPHTLM